MPFSSLPSPRSRPGSRSGSTGSRAGAGGLDRGSAPSRPRRRRPACLDSDDVAKQALAVVRHVLETTVKETVNGLSLLVRLSDRGRRLAGFREEWVLDRGRQRLHRRLVRVAFRVELDHG